MTVKRHSITVKISPRYNPWRQIWGLCLQVGVIGIGVVLDSVAMQWAGFIVLLLVALLASLRMMLAHEELTIEEARRVLDQLEREEKWDV
jgi:hypothetical protein